ncbi:hypothetical protein BDR26DRAFT_880696 [Obelidium mucronatum]|nr:hypothetical protein BDR26DRAFT_880696 [Obelidium mucronatum]
MSKLPPQQQQPLKGFRDPLSFSVTTSSSSRLNRPNIPSRKQSITIDQLVMGNLPSKSPRKRSADGPTTRTSHPLAQSIVASQQQQYSIQQAKQNSMLLQHVPSPKDSYVSLDKGFKSPKGIFSPQASYISIDNAFKSKESNSDAMTTQLATKDALKRVMDVKGESVRGPMILQMIGNYVFSLVFLGVANQTNWAPYIRFYLAFLYVVLSYCVLEVTRISHARGNDSLMQFYTSILPFIVFIFISREAHIMGFLLWYVAFMLIYLQSGFPHLARHMIAYTLVTGMFYFYKDNCPFIVCGQPLSPPIDYRYEIMVIIEALALGMNFLLVEQYIKLNAATLLDRDVFLKAARQAEILDLESPMTKVLQILNEIKADESVADDFMVKELDRLIKILNSDQLYTPDIFQKSADADVSEWLKAMMQTAKAEVGTASSTSTTINASAALVAGETTKSGVPTVTFTLSPEQPMSNQESKVFELLANIDDPNFDVATVESASNGRVLFYVGYYLFAKHDLLRKHRISENTFRSWLTRIEHGYRGTNPYHNATHAADVAHSMNYFITRSRIWNRITPEEQLASLIAAIIHDFMHPGVNNSFLINASDPLALRYNDVAVLENFHCATVFEIMDASHDLNILKSLSMDSQRQVRETVVSACADVNNPTKPLSSCKFWTERIMEEFFRQGDEERKRGVPISMFMNRASTDIPKCQLGFIDFIVYPLFEVWAGFMEDDLSTQMANIANNKRYWKEQTLNNQSVLS